MGRLGLSELLVIVIMFAVPIAGLGVAFVIGFFVGKGVGFKQGLREAQQLRQAGPPGS